MLPCNTINHETLKLAKMESQGNVNSPRLTGFCLSRYTMCRIVLYYVMDVAINIHTHSINQLLNDYEIRDF